MVIKIRKATRPMLLCYCEVKKQSLIIYSFTIDQQGNGKLDDKANPCGCHIIQTMSKKDADRLLSKIRHTVRTGEATADIHSLKSNFIKKKKAPRERLAQITKYSEDSAMLSITVPGKK